MGAEPVYEDGTPMPRCQYCGEFFTGYPGNQICADCHEHIVGMEKTIASLRDEKRRLLTFRGAVDGFETALGVYENCMDAHCGVGGFCDEQKRSLADALQHKGAARAAVTDIEPEVAAEVERRRVMAT